MSRSVAALAALSTLLAPAAGFAQEPEPDAVFGEVVEVRVVNVEAVVTDRDGNRVFGLGPEDFRLLVDGEPTPIDYFSEVLSGAAVATEDETVPGLPAAVPGERVGVNYLVFVDDFFALPNDRNRVLRTLKEDVEQLDAADRMAIVAFDGTRLERLTDWTASKQELRDALERARKRPAQGLARRGELRAHDELHGRPSPRDNDRLLTPRPEDRMFAAQIQQQLGRSIGAAEASLRYMGRPPGRKVALLLSGGWPISSGGFAAGSGEIITVDTARQDQRTIRPLLDTANLLGYTLYPVDVPGLRGASGADVEQAGRAFDDVGLAVTTDPTATLGSARERERLQQDSLYALAGATGGRAFIAGRARRALPEVARDTESYYWLGFTPDRRRDDRGHEIRVEVTNPELRIRSRSGYRDLSRAAEQRAAIAASLLFGAPATAAERELEVAEVVPQGRKEAELSLVVRIPLDEVVLVPDGGGWIGRLEVRAGAVDEKRRNSELPSAPFDLRLPDEPPAGAEYTLRIPLVVRRAPQTVVVHVTDTVGGRTLSYRAEVDP